MFKRYEYRAMMLGAICAKAEQIGNKPAAFATMGKLDGMIIILRYQSCGRHLIQRLRDCFRQGYDDYRNKCGYYGDWRVESAV